MSELSKEMKLDLVKGLQNDNMRMTEAVQRILQPTYHSGIGGVDYSHHDIEQLVYVTEEMRLKLKLLGGARIYEL